MKLYKLNSKSEDTMIVECCILASDEKEVFSLLRKEYKETFIENELLNELENMEKLFNIKEIQLDSSKLIMFSVQI